MWLIAVIVTLVMGLIIQGMLMPNDTGLIFACFVSIIIMGGFIMYQLGKIQKNLDTIMTIKNNDSISTNSSISKES